MNPVMITGKPWASDPVPTDPVPIPEPIPTPQPMPDPPPSDPAPILDPPPYR
ncbi:proline-rich small protein YnaL [Erwinia psidii]